MTEESVGALVSEAENRGYVNENGKAFPYLGWFWRDISRDYGVRVSWFEGKHWVNEPAKWDYPSSYVTDEDLHEMLDALAENMKKRVEQGGILHEDKVRVQEILYEAVGDIHKEVTYCELDDCDYQTLNGYRFLDHLDDAHPDWRDDDRGVREMKSVEQTEVLNGPPEEIFDEV